MTNTERLNAYVASLLVWNVKLHNLHWNVTGKLFKPLHEYTEALYDKAFEAYCLGEFDVDGDGRISRYEAQRVRTVECPERGVASLSDLKEFTRLERLDCRGNALTRLDVTMTRLEWLDCSDNGLVSLDVNGLRGLAYLDCGGNSLPRLDLQSNASLATLLCPDNALAGSLDVTSCASGLRADVRGNPSLATVYCLASQSVDFNGPTELVRK